VIEKSDWVETFLRLGSGRKEKKRIGGYLLKKFTFILIFFTFPLEFCKIYPSLYARLKNCIGF